MTPSMLRMAAAFALVFLSLLTLSGAAEESVELLILSPTNPTPTHQELAVSLPTQHLKIISSTVLEAEAWLRSHVLSHYPSSKITHIAVAHNLPCPHHRHQFAHLLLPSLKNLHHSLTRWGLRTEIKISPSISSHCLEAQETMAGTLMEPLLDFIRTTNSTFLINPSKPISEISGEIHGLKKLGSFDIKLVLHDQTHKTTISRKLSSLASMAVEPSYPVRPTPFTERSPSANVAKSPLPPLIGSPLYFPPLVGPPPSSSPTKSPVVFPAPPPFGGFHLPPCNPAPAPVVVGEKLWCVAKPSVPVDTLQEAIDFACGEGGADCEEIQPDGSCYNPDTVIAHASYAFNSYWQKTRRNGGSCGFGGTAMIINADPSFENCRFVVT